MRSQANRTARRPVVGRTLGRHGVSSWHGHSRSGLMCYIISSPISISYLWIDGGGTRLREAWLTHATCADDTPVNWCVENLAAWWHRGAFKISSPACFHRGDNNIATLGEGFWQGRSIRCSCVSFSVIVLSFLLYLLLGDACFGTRLSEVWENQGLGVVYILLKIFSVLRRSCHRFQTTHTSTITSKPPHCLHGLHRSSLVPADI